MTIGINVCRSCTCCELTVDPTTGRCEDGHEAPPSPLPYDNCGRGCYTVAGHTMAAGRCAHASEPAGDEETVPVPRQDLDQLLAVATLYLESFGPDEKLSYAGLLALQDIDATVARYGKRY